MAERLLTANTIPSIADIEDRLKRKSSVRIGWRALLLAILMIVTAGLFVLTIAKGSVDIPFEQVIKVLAGGEADRLAYTRIVQNFRLPKALTASLAGAALAVSGLQMQTFFRNPLAGPFVLGISSGASLGVGLVVLGTTTATGGGILLATVTDAGPFTLALAASLGAALVMGIVLVAARFVEGNVTLLIIGLMIGYMTSALVTLLMYFSIAEQIQAYIDWTFGSFSGVTWTKMKVFGPVIGVGLLLSLTLSKSLNALLLGEKYARTMGVRVGRTRTGILLSTALLAGTVTAFCGPIAFLGLAVPHLSRSAFNSSDHRLLIPGTILMGALVALASALIAELPGSNATLPLNAVTAFVGAPVVIWVIIGRRAMQKSFGT